MKYYSHHIGDFDKATRHLTRLERSIYRDLIELYYDIEQQLPLDITWICRRIIARSNEEATAVEQTLNEFFTETPNGWWHDRCEEELDAYRSSNSQKSIAGKASAAKRAMKRQQALNGNPTAVEQTLNESSTDVEQTFNGRGTASQLTNNHKPLTINHIEKENNKKKKEITVEIDFYDVPEKIVNDFKSHRKLKKAPITQTAIDGIRKEADKAGISLAEALMHCCSRGWTGFKASWIKEEPRARGSPYQSRQEKTQAWVDKLLGTKNNERPPDVIDIN